MDFCAAKRPSELLARVKLRVAERQAVAVTAKISEYTAAGLATGAECVELTRIVTELKGKDAAGVNEVGVEDDVEEEKVATFQQGSSKDLLYLDATIDPFSACAPRSMSPALQSSKGKGKALATGSGVVSLPFLPRIVHRLTFRCCRVARLLVTPLVLLRLLRFSRTGRRRRLQQV